MEIKIRNVSKEAVAQLDKLATHYDTSRNEICVDIIETAAQEVEKKFASFTLRNDLDDVRLSLDKLTEAENKSKEVNSNELSEIKQALQYIIDKID